MYNLFEFQDPISFSNTGQLHYVDAFLFERDWRKGQRHSHEISELFFCIQGNGVFSVRDQELTVCPMDCIFVSPYVVHTEWSTPASPLEYVCLGISGVNLHPESRRDGYSRVNFGSISGTILPLLSALVQEVSAKNPGYEEISSHIMSILMLYLNRRTTLVFQATASVTVSGNHMIPWIHQYLNDNFTKEINLDLLADKAGVNKYSLIRSFQKIYGVTPIDYALNLRIQEAKFLLRTTDHPILQIASNLGFSSPNYFSQSFQRREGISPTRYRMLHLRSGRNLTDPSAEPSDSVSD